MSAYYVATVFYMFISVCIAGVGVKMFQSCTNNDSKKYESIQELIGGIIIIAFAIFMFFYAISISFFQ